MINYEIDPEILKPFLPKGTEIDLWKGKAYISLVGFMFLNTRIKGISIPFHINFEEVNLRFYIKRVTIEGERRAVAFIKEIVPKRGIATLARLLYNEKYVALPMRHQIEETDLYVSAEYEWKFKGEWQKIAAKSHQVEPKAVLAGSEAEFITEHYWGYSSQRNGGTIEYQVLHPSWKVWEVDCLVNVDTVGLYGPSFAPFLQKPSSAFLAEGSDVEVYSGCRLIL